MIIDFQNAQQKQQKLFNEDIKSYDEKNKLFITDNEIEEINNKTYMLSAAFLKMIEIFFIMLSFRSFTLL